MSFEENFPSMRSTNWNLPVDEYYIKEEMLKYCLDKQRVKEAISECELLNDSTYIDAAELISKLNLSYSLKELGLEEEE